MLILLRAIPSLILWLLLVPFCVGMLVNFILPRARRTIGITFILGYLVYMAVFEVIAITCMLKATYSAFTYCRQIFIVVVSVLAIAGIVRSFLKLRDGEKNYLTLFPGEAHADVFDLMSPRANPGFYKHDYSKESRIYWGIFFAIMAFQMIMSVVMASFDGDDAYYVVESLLAQKVDVMNTILPYTGSSTYLDIRHALAVITMWIAFIAKESGIHATILSHSVMPLFLIPLVYLVYVEIGRVLFRTRQQIIPVFMIIVSFLLMFGNVSIYTPATFFLMRTWQGKALVANLVFPMIFWIFLWMFEEAKQTPAPNRKEKEWEQPRRDWCPWIELFFVNMLSGTCSSLGVIFGSGLIALLTLVLLFYTRKIKVIFGALLCIIPNLVYLMIYFSIFLHK
ncbi:hypothetical protein D6855_12395 [Butyrivibrio sp. CB08]|uniref:DUF6077 domain-containing protein n=1 Tax=Butyrivibrio sp. CB08 TaxID=2364879 RepID=UPI000EAA294D|nr:DUF6077 domain-containing protein [Butyrivibrio sp. CB08]RKM57843.1 hypothetical protein D6855_12395 [Butyrivibrio sp. CB08]